MSAEDTVQAFITDARTNSNEALEQAFSYAQQAATAANSVLVGLPPIPFPTEVEVEVPEFNPNVDLSGEFNSAYDNAVSTFGPEFQVEMDSFLNTYFPDFSTRMQTSVDNWIYDTITTGATGIPTAVENQIWDRARSKELLDASRARSDVTAQWASRGWSMPTGVLAQQLMQIDQDTSSKISAHARDVAIKQAEIVIDSVKFAVEQGARMRLGVVAALVDYMRAFMAPWELAIRKAEALVDAKSRLWQSSAAYYGALISAAELHLKFDQLSIDRALGANKLTVDQVIGTVNNRVNAAVSAAQAMANTASAALSSQVSLAKIGNETVSESSS